MEKNSFHVTALSATARSGKGVFSLTPEDREHPIVAKRIHAKKGIAFHRIEDRKILGRKVAEIALSDGFKANGQAILIFLRALKDVEAVEGLLRKANQKVCTLLRYAAKNAALNSGWSPEKVGGFILGHGERRDDTHVPIGPQRFAYLPLPSIEYRGGGKLSVGPIRRVLVTALGDGCEAEVAWATNTLPAQDMVDERSGEVLALLSPLPTTDKVTARYTGKASTWSSVTPVVLPGYDDPNYLRRKLARSGITAEKQRKYLEQLYARIDRLLRRALVHSGFAPTLAEQAALDWRKVGFLPGVESAERYGVPEHLRRLPRYHVLIQFLDSRGAPVEVRGPLCIGSGRHYGIGLFATHSD